MPNTIVDLHLHTYYSDGRASPAEILHHAAAIGLKTVAITDHDNINAAEEAEIVAKKLGLELIPAVEITSTWKDCVSCYEPGFTNQDVDILGYFIDRRSPALVAFCKAAMADFTSRISDCCTYLQKSGYPLSIYDVLDENPRFPGDIQVIQALLHRRLARDFRQASSLFLEAFQNVRPSSTTVEQAIQIIHAAGGAAVLAHPVIINGGKGRLTRDDLQELIMLGLDGIEVYHPRLDSEAQAYYRHLAEEYNLCISGGSDEHGGRDRFTRLGSQLVTYEMVAELRERARRRQDQSLGKNKHR